MDVFEGKEQRKTIEPALAFKNYTFHVRTVLYLLEVFFTYMASTVGDGTSEK